jgi:hypothetical protein
MTGPIVLWPGRGKQQLKEGGMFDGKGSRMINIIISIDIVEIRA